MSAQPVDVLAAEREQAEAMAALLQGKRSAADWTRAAVANAKAIEARAAVAELIEAAKPVAGGHRFVGNRDMNRLRAALARVQGGQS